MKKIIILIVFCTQVSMPAMSVQKCVLSPNSEQDVGGVSVGMIDNTDWYVNFIGASGELLVKYKGIALCAMTSGRRSSATDYISQSTNFTANKYCWCKTVSPAESKWIAAFTEDLVSGGDCLSRCSTACGDLYRYHLAGDGFFYN